MIEWEQKDIENNKNNGNIGHIGKNRNNANNGNNRTNRNNGNNQNNGKDWNNRNYRNNGNNGTNRNIGNNRNIRELTDNIPNWSYYPQLGISNPQLGIISNWGLGIYDSGNTESENKSPIPNWIKYY